MDTTELERRIAAQRTQEEISRVESLCEANLASFEGRELTNADRQFRRMEFLRFRAELGELAQRVLRLRCARDL
jgi:hypothetical protein